MNPPGAQISLTLPLSATPLYRKARYQRVRHAENDLTAALPVRRTVFSFIAPSPMFFSARMTSGRPTKP